MHPGRVLRAARETRSRRQAVRQRESRDSAAITRSYTRLHPAGNGSLERGALASCSMITTTIQRGTGLTTRQREVVALIAAGCSNDEVGERLGISPRTAKAHSDTLRSKLGVSRRRQIPVAFRVLTGEDPLSASLGALDRRPGV